MSDERRCPACRAPWRQAAICPRCGADLGPLMRLAARAWTLREAARLALLAGDTATARALARAAYDLERTQRARRLRALALVASGDAARARELIAEESNLLVPPPQQGRAGSDQKSARTNV